jgi:hypothetical protein
MPSRSRRAPNRAVVQRALPFVERLHRRDRLFRRAIVVLTLLTAGGLALGTPTGRDAMSRSVAWTRGIGWRALGFPQPRDDIEAEWARRRRRDVETASATFRRVYDEAPPAVKRLMDYAGMGRGSALLRWGNYDKILVLPSAVFAPDERRSYRLLPNLRSVWLMGVDLTHGMNGFFLVPDTPELPSAMAGTRARIVPGSAQTTNSWSCRGPEPDPSAPIRGIVLGDSNMQGYFVADDDTPPIFLGRELEARLGARASILNTGVLGYSPEQYYFSLVEYAERLKPQFVVVTLCVNDFGDVADVIAGRGDYVEAKYWLDRIDDYCRPRGIMTVTAPVPYDDQVTGLRRGGNFPGKADNLLRSSSPFYCFPIEELIDEVLRLRTAEAAQGRRMASPNPLYNLHLGDHHFTARGAEVWGRAVGRRIALLLNRARSRGTGLQ